MPVLLDIHASPLGLTVITCSFDYHKHLITWLFLAAGEVLSLLLGEFVPLAREYPPPVEEIISMERLILLVQDKSWDYRVTR